MSDLDPRFIQHVWPWLDMALFCFSPFVIILVCDVIIIRQIMTSERRLARHRNRWTGHRNSVAPATDSHSVATSSGRNYKASSPGNISTASCSDKSSKSKIYHLNKKPSIFEKTSFVLSSESQQPRQSIELGQYSTHEMTKPTMSSAKPVTTQTSTSSTSTSSPRPRKSSSSVTVTLLAVTLTFLVLNAPLNAYFITNALSSTSEAAGVVRRNLAYALTSCLGYLNNALHVFLYCLTGPKFRQEFNKLINGLFFFFMFINIHIISF